MRAGRASEDDVMTPNVIHLRVDKELRARLQCEAKTHRVTLTAEIRQRLAASLDSRTKRDLEDILQDMQISWALHQNRFTRLELAHALVDAILRGEGPETIKPLAQELRRRRDLGRAPA